MTTNLLPLFNRLHQAAPEMCQKRNDYFVIGNYLFFDWGNGEFVARIDKLGSDSYGGQPALDWLTGALMAAIEARGWDVELKTYKHRTHARIFNDAGVEALSGWQDTLAEALLTALLAAVEAERVR